MQVLFLTVLLFVLLSSQCDGFVSFSQNNCQRLMASSQRKGGVLQMSTAELGLTQELEKLVNGFQAMPDDKMRYKQLLFMASKAEEMAPELKTPENKVQGCLSTVHVHAVKRDGLVFYQGDSDGLLTKGLVTILVRGLSGNSPEDIQQVKPEFIKAAGLATSLTPGRNNGFINMLAKMKKVAVELQDTPAEAEPTEPQAQEEIQEQNEAPAAAAENSRPIYSAMMAKLSILKPALLEVTDDSAGHAGHKEAQNIQSDESHFSVKIVGSCFEGLSLVKRHQLVYTVLAEEMKTIHAIQINAKTPEEVGL